MAPTSAPPPVPTDLRVDFERDPANVPVDAPRFSWRVEGAPRGSSQAAYRLLVADRRGALPGGGEDLSGDRRVVWDSGTVTSGRSTGVEYRGPPLTPDATYYWTVTVRHGDGTGSEYAEPASFATALADPPAWDADWIAHQPEGGDANGYRSRWHAAGTDVPEEWVQVDLGTVAGIDGIELHPATPFDGPTTPDGAEVSSLYSAASTDEPPHVRDGADGFGFPARYRVEVSDDPSFAESRTVVDRTDADRPNPGTDPVSIDADGAAGRYVRVTATDLYEFDPGHAPQLDGESQAPPGRIREERSRWRVFALASLAVRDDAGTDLAAGRPVTASSSHEDGTWGRASLVDGRRESTVASGSPLLRTEFDLSRPPARARAHLAVGGYGELHLNGETVGDRVLDPAWTRYDDRLLYASYDVTEQLREGENAVGLWLGRGWFAKNFYGWTGFGSPRAALQLTVEYDDGTTRTVTTSPDWRATSSPILENDIYHGETYDARREQPGWAAPGFDDADWEQAAAVPAPGGDLHPQRTDPIRVVETRDPVRVGGHDDGSGDGSGDESGDGTGAGSGDGTGEGTGDGTGKGTGAGTIVDFGQNLTGWVELVVDDPSPGDRIEIAHAEALADDGSLSRETLRTARATDTYVASGDDRETYEPRFTYHGFRYALVEGYPGDLPADAIRAKVVHTDLEPTGEFECSDEDLNAVQRNCRWGLRSNAHGVPTDCPQRDERLGWTGDGHLAARALLYNFDAYRFHRKWLRDHDDAQSGHGYLPDTVPRAAGRLPGDPSWTLSRVVLPWYLYRHSGDRRLLADNYEGMRRYVDYWDSVAEDHVVPAEYGNYGDWLACEHVDDRRGRPFDLFNTAAHYLATARVGEAASALGAESDAARYRTRAGAIADAFNDRFFDPARAVYGPGSQAAAATALFLDIVPDGREDDVVATLVEKIRSEDDAQLRTGFLGTRRLLFALVEHGHVDLAYELVSQPERPGWVYMVRDGATTVWESWDSDERRNSFNHSPYALVSEWFYRVLAGLRIGEAPGVDHLEVAPSLPSGLSSAAGRVETVHGTLASRWERTADGVTYRVTVPWNSTATLRMPAPDGDVRVSEADTLVRAAGEVRALPDGVRGVGERAGAVEVELGSGTYRFDVRG